MKRKIIIFIILAFFGLAKANAFSVAIINGHVTNTLTNSPAVSHTVIITDSIGFTQIYHTDINGYYYDSISNSSPNPIKYYILIYDCNNQLHFDTVTTTSYAFKTANFSICYNYIDAGVTDIITPTNPVQVGDTVPLIVKFKNYSTQTINSLEIGFKINGQLLSPFNWAGALTSGSSFTIQIGSYIVQNQNNVNFVSYTNLTGDMYHNNDTCFKALSLVPQYDAGVIDIIIPTSTTAGDTVNPIVKFKNYGSSTLTNISIYLSMNGYYNNPGNWTNWTGNLPQDSVTTISFGNFIITNVNNNFISYTLLGNDMHHSNDTCYKSINVNPALIDAGIVDIINPANIVCSSIVAYPKVIIKNFGTTPLTSIPVGYQRGVLPPVTATWTRITPLNYGDTVHFIFTTPFTVPIGTSFQFSAFTSLVNDANPLNNKIVKSIVISSSSIPTTFSILGDDTVIIGQSNVIYHTSYLSSSNDQYIWTLPPGAVIDSANANYISVHYLSNAQSGNISCKIMNVCGSSQTMVLPVHVFVTPPPPIIFQNGNTLNSGYSTGNQWYFENNAIPGATQSTYTATQTGHYYCIVTLDGSTSPQSNTIYVAFAGIDEEFIKSHFEVFPNPVNDRCNFKYSLNKKSLVELKLTDIVGRLIKTLVNNEQASGDYDYQLNSSDLAKGIYIYKFSTDNNVTIKGKLIIIK